MRKQTTIVVIGALRVNMYPEDIFSYGAARIVFYPTYLDRQTCADSVDPDKTPHNAATDLGLHCLQLI